MPQEKNSKNKNMRKKQKSKNNAANMVEQCDKKLQETRTPR